MILSLFSLASQSQIFFEDGFESGDLSTTSSGGFSWGSLNRTSLVTQDPEDGNVVIFNGSSIYNIVNDSRDWTAKNGDNSMRFRYPSGQEMSEQRFFIGEYVPDLWVSYWIRVPVNFTHGSLNNKWLALWVENYDTQGDVTWQTRPNGSGGANLVVQDGGVTSGEVLSTPFISVPGDRGRWMQVVVRVKTATSDGSEDGIIQFYRRWEGESTFTKLQEILDANVWEAEGDGIKYGYLMGWANDPYDENTEWLLDDFTLSTSSLLTTSPTYTLTVNSGSGDGDYEESTVVNISAETPPANKEFDEWTGDVDSVASVSAANTTIIMPDAATTITATYKDILYNLTVNSGTGDGNYAIDSVVSISADTPPSGQEFDQWTGDISNIDDVNAASTTITMPGAAASVTATYRNILENVALNKTAVSSGNQYAQYDASYAIDNSETTLWSTDTPYPQSLEVDLGDVYSISSTISKFYQDRAYQYRIEIKVDSTSAYTEIVDKTSNTTPAPITDNFSTINARYVKLTITGASGYGGSYVSVNEFEVYGSLAPTSSNLALNQSATSSGNQYAQYPASDAVDGSTSTIWSTDAEGYPQSLEVDLGDIYSINATELVCYQDRAYQFTVEVKTTSGGSYTQVVDRTANTTPGTALVPISDNFAITDARYVKITIAGASGYAGNYISLSEFRVFGWSQSSGARIASGESLNPEEVSISEEADILIYPNPARSMLTIKGRSSEFEGNTFVKMYNEKGQKVYESQVERFPYKVDISSFSQGLYFIKIGRDDKYFIRRMIKE